VRGGLFAAVNVLILAAAASAATISVPANGDLQAALNAAQPGDVIELQPGATYVGNFTLPNKSGSSYITVRTGSLTTPADGVRVGPADAPSLAKLRSPNTAPALRTAIAAHHWRILRVEFLATAGGAGDIITLGSGSSSQTSLSQVAHDLILDRVYVHGDPAAGQKRAIALNSAATTITNSYIADIKAVGQDSQAIGGWNGPGPFTISNNYLEAAGENLMFGGADPSVQGLVPADITITDNRFAKQTSWRGQSWVVKNILELKNARRVTIARNTFEYNWQGGQSGFAIVFTVRNQDGGCPWCQVDHVTFEQNIVRHVAAGISILGYDNNHPSLQTQAIVVRNNLFADIDRNAWGGNGYFLQMSGGPRDITIDHNTIIQGSASGLVLVDGPAVPGFVFTNNVGRHSTYGIIGTNHRSGNDTIAAYFPAAQITSNVIADGDARNYPSGNRFPTSAAFDAQFVSSAAGDYGLVASSAWQKAGSDGADLGAAESVSQGTVCTGVIGADTTMFGSRGGSRNWSLTISSQTCRWSSSATVSWLSVSPARGVGNATITVTAQANTAMTPRQAALTVAEQPMSVTQDKRARPRGAGDFDGDGMSDLALFRPGTAEWQVLTSSSAYLSALTIQWGVSTDVRVPGDYDGDGIDDLALYRPSTGTWYILQSSTQYSTYITQQWGNSTDTPVSGDYDGDGKSDLALYRSATGTWYVELSSTNFTTYLTRQWGLGSDTPVPDDYDGDGRTDLGLYRASTGSWYVLKSSSNFTDYIVRQWGLSTDRVAPGDYDGDGKADLAVYRAETGFWYILQSSTNYSTYIAKQWGASTDVLVPGDYDGDGKSDLAQYRPSTGVWYLLSSRSGSTTYDTHVWGVSTDVPINAH
jgi:hypothetical protein